MGVRFCYASISEKKSINGRPGNQTGSELRIRSEYDFGQNWVIRAKSKRKRLRIASAARRFVNNKKIGYGQSDRDGLFNEMKRLGFKISKISKVRICNTDCSSMASTAINCAFNKNLVPKELTTHGMFDWFTLSKDFKVMRFKKGMRLMKGDLVHKVGHVVIVYEGGFSQI